MCSLLGNNIKCNIMVDIPIILGYDDNGNLRIIDLAKAPHILIAGINRSENSAGTNMLIASLLLRFKPNELQLLLFSPENTKFEHYKTLPHLFMPIISDACKIPEALFRVVLEIEKRYQILAQSGVGTWNEYNRRQFVSELISDKMPILIVIISELAELQKTERREDAENYIARIAQIGASVGVHIVAVTQQPSCQTITGKIKVNLPTRIVFRVNHRCDSYILLDQEGAEKLLGMGDMLLLTLENLKPECIQSVKISDADLNQVVGFLTKQYN